MPECHSDRPRFIPYRKRDIVRMCLSRGELGAEAERFTRFCKILSHVFHYEFMATLESLKESYGSLDPDTDTLAVFDGQENSADDFVSHLKAILDQANYEPISRAELNQALEDNSLFQLRLNVDFDAFSDVLLFYRGQSLQKESVPRWFGLSVKEVEFINYDRVLIYLRFKPEERPTDVNPMPQPDTGIMLKLFRNVPKADLEMLFPNTTLGMRLVDKVLIGVPALVSGGIVVSTKLGATLLLLASMLGFWLGIRQQPVDLNMANLTVLFAGLGAFGGYLWKQFSNFKNRKLLFMQQLTQHLYFKNLDNNAGVFHRLLDEAEEEECKEAILAYYFLVTSKASLSQLELDQKIEQWLVDKWGGVVDFEVGDALNKLMRLELVQVAEGKYRAISLAKALEKLDQRWDAYF